MDVVRVINIHIAICSRLELLQSFIRVILLGYTVVNLLKRIEVKHHLMGVRTTTIQYDDCNDDYYNIRTIYIYCSC